MYKIEIQAYPIKLNLKLEQYALILIPCPQALYLNLLVTKSTALCPYPTTALNISLDFAHTFL